MDKSGLSPNERADDAINEFRKLKEEIERHGEDCPPEDDTEAWTARLQKTVSLGARLLALSDLRKALSRGGADDPAVDRYKQAVKADFRKLAEKLWKAFYACFEAIGVGDEQAVQGDAFHLLYHTATLEKRRILQSYGLPAEPYNPKEEWLVGACETPGDCPLERSLLGEQRATSPR